MWDTYFYLEFFSCDSDGAVMSVYFLLLLFFYKGPNLFVLLVSYLEVN